MADEKSNQVRDLLTELAGAQVMSELVSRVVAKVTEDEMRDLAAGLVRSLAVKIEQGDFIFDLQQRMIHDFMQSESWKEIVAASESTIAETVRDSVKNRLRDFARILTHQWFEPVVEAARRRFEKLLSSM
jgi:hypothetical protein